jgi:hypothetical protein
MPYPDIIPLDLQADIFTLFQFDPAAGAVLGVDTVPGFTT